MRTKAEHDYPAGDLQLAFHLGQYAQTLEFAGLAIFRFKAWWTDVTGTTDAAGVFRTRAFCGDHEVTLLGPDGQPGLHASVSVPRTGATVTLEP